jgi:hypothetical protein
MAFALDSFFADGYRYMGPGPLGATQRVVFQISATAADVDLDIGDLSGTFWTAALADGTTGSMAAAVLEQLETIIDKCNQTVNVFCPQVFGIPVAAAAAAGVMAQSVSSTTLLPSYTFDTGEGLTAYTVYVDLELNEKEKPVNLYYNV